MVQEVSFYLPYLDSNDAPKTTHRKSVVIGVLFLERHGMETKWKSGATSARSHNLEHSAPIFDLTSPIFAGVTAADSAMRAIPLRPPLYRSVLCGRCGERSVRIRLFPHGIEPGAFRVLGGCDNHYATETPSVAGNGECQ